jgi:hypothetical protein
MPEALDDVAVIVGAGISFEAPTAAAGFGEIRDAFLRRAGIKLEEDGRKLLPGTEDLSPEQIFEALDDDRDATREAIQADLWHMCEAGSPNLNHHAVRALIEAGAKVWTPNFDNMIERSFRDPKAVEVVVDGPRTPRPGLALMKPHGSFPLEPENREPERHDYQLLFRSSAVWHLDAEWQRQLEADCAGRDVFLFGYRGADPDLTPAILLALVGARSATWWECDENNLDRLHGFTERVAVEIRAGDPSRALRDLAKARVGFDPDSVQLEASTGSPGSDYRPRYLPSYESRAGLAGLVQGAAAARRLRWEGIRREQNSSRRKIMAFKLLRSTGYDLPVAKAPLRLALALALRRPGEGDEERAFLATNYLTLVDSGPLRRADRRVIARVRRMGIETPGIDVRLASIAKRWGDLTVARADAERALATVGDNVLLEAMTVYNLAWIYRQMAAFSKRELLLRNYEDRSAHIGPNWAAWLAIDDALLALHFGDWNRADDQMSAPLAQFSRETVNHPAYVQDHEIASALIAWHKGDPTGAGATLRTSLAKRSVARFQPALYSSITTQILLADLARAHGDLGLMEARLRKARRRTRSTIQRGQIDLVRAEGLGDQAPKTAI